MVVTLVEGLMHGKTRRTNSVCKGRGRMVGDMNMNRVFEAVSLYTSFGS